MSPRAGATAPPAAVAAASDGVRLPVLEATIRRVRWGALGFVVLRFAVIDPARVDAMPVPRWLALALIVAAVVAANAASQAAVRAGDADRIRHVGLLGLAVDTVIASAVIALLDFDPALSTWPLLTLPIAEGAARAGLPGAAAVWATCSAVFVTDQLVWLVDGGPTHPWLTTIPWAVGILGFVAIGTGLLARRFDTSSIRQREETERLRRLAELAPSLSASRDRRSVYRRLVETGVELTGFEAAALFEYGGGDLWIRRASFGTRSTEVGDPETIPAFTELAQRGPDPFPIEPAGGIEERWRRIVPDTVHGVVAPVRHDDHTIGLLLLATADRDRELTDEIGTVLRLLTAHAAVAIENARVAAAEERTIRELRELDHMKDEFVSLLTHELRSPMASMAGSAELLRQRWQDLSPARREEFLGLIERGTRRLSLLVEDVVDAMRATGGLRIDVAELDLAPLLRDTAQQEVDPSPRHQLVLRIDPTTPRALGDPVRVTQVLHNLLNNAVKYSPAGGEIHVSLRLDHGEVAVSVSDPGLGIPETERHRLFEKFQRLHRDQPIPGTGLGLYLVRSLVEAMNGSITVDSTEGQGATFRVFLPVAEPHREEARDLTPSAAGERRPPR